jgi:hypothetical protein
MHVWKISQLNLFVQLIYTNKKEGEESEKKIGMKSLFVFL